MKRILIIFLLIGSALCAAQGKQAMQLSACASCHGERGISNNPEWPNLAGQHAAYLLKQLQDYKKVSTRNAPVMTSLVANLSEADLIELANAYSRFPLPESSMPQQYLARGQQLYRGGDFTKHITACIACHGPQGTGNAQAGFPVLSGQNPEYTIQQLQAFKDKKRSNDLNAIMRDISARMSTEDMTAVAYYVAGLH